MASASVPTLSGKQSFVAQNMMHGVATTSAPGGMTSPGQPTPPYSAPATVTAAHAVAPNTSMASAVSTAPTTAPPTPAVIPSSASSAILQHQASQQSIQQQPASYNGQGSINTMNEIYDVGEVIGTGTFGIIRKVTRKTDGLVLARKELDYGRMDERDLKQLSEEVNILQNLEPNDNIVRYYERYVDRQNFRLHIIMEYCHNGDLAAQIQRCRRKNILLHEDTVWLYLAQISTALADCHAETDKHGRPKQVILHRDIKPENVFLDKDNMIKLGDFGLSKAMANAAFTNTYVGTPYYMSPELINGQAYDNKSDIWALGCLIFELCAWLPPFHEARTQAELTKLIREGKIPNLPSKYSQNLQMIVKLMLRQDPKQRPTIEQIKGLEEVRLQQRILDLRKMHEEMKRRHAELVIREAACLERERALSLRERELELERTEMQHERVRLAQVFSNMTAYHTSTSGASSSGLSTAPSSRDTSPLMDQKELVHGLHVITQGLAHAGESMSMESKTLSRMASRPSLVPRRPLEERRASTNGHTLSKRYSCQSLQSMAVDGETPVKAGQATPTAESRRRGVPSSKSMHNLKASGGSRTESPTMRTAPSLPTSSKHQTNGPLSAGPNVPSFNFTYATSQGRPSSVSTVSELGAPSSKRSESSASLVNTTVSPVKRPQPMSRTATAPPLLPSSSTPSLASLAAALPSATSGPKYNLDDEDSLPSPFLKKKASMGLRAMAAAQAATASGNSSTITRRQSSSNLSSIAGSVGSARGLRPSTTRQSLAGKLALHRQSSKVDEQGRRM